MSIGEGKRLFRVENLRERMMQRDNELYRIGRIYENKGRFGKFIMRITSRGSKSRELESGRVVYSRHHYRESVVEAYNKEVMASWSD